MPERELHQRFKGYVCIVDGCTRVEYKHELCHGHWQEVPDALVDEIMIGSIRAAMDASRAYDDQIRALAKGMSAPATARASRGYEARATTTFAAMDAARSPQP